MHSPVSSVALGECNAITNGDSVRGRLTFAANLETAFGASHKPVCRQSRDVGDHKQICPFRNSRGQDASGVLTRIQILHNEQDFP
jgi:hypothetical protein